MARTNDQYEELQNICQKEIGIRLSRIKASFWKNKNAYPGGALAQVLGFMVQTAPRTGRYRQYYNEHSDGRQ